MEGILRVFSNAAENPTARPELEFRAVHKDGHPVWCYSQPTLILAQGQITGFNAIIQNITTRKQAEAALRESELKVSEALEFNRKILNSSSIGILTYKESGQCVSANAAASKITGGTLAQLLAQNFHEIPSWKKYGIYPAAIRALDTGIEQLLEVRSVTTFGKDVWVSFSFSSFDSAGERHLLVFTSDITEHKQAEEALRESRARLARLSRNLVEAQEQERRRIARELHDEVGQSLTALTISLDGVSQLALNGVIRGKIAETQELTKNLIAEVNALSVELRPRVLDDLGLIPGLLSLFSRFSTQPGVEIDFKHTGIERKRVTPEIEISAYRIIQEALTNVVRHAGVKTASVRLQVEGDVLYIQVQDEGKGFDLQQALNAEDSMGLLSMTERAEQVGGHLEVETAPGEGTLIACRLPLGRNHIERREHEYGENRPGG